MTREIINYLDTNENEYIKHPNLWDAVKAVVRGKFVPISAYIKKKKVLKSIIQLYTLGN